MTDEANCSVLMAVYGRERPEYLDDCLASLENQSQPASQVVLVEDGPLGSQLRATIDRYRSILPIDSVRLRKNVGLPDALNAGLDACRHELVARMDSDDICKPDRLKRQLDFMARNPEVHVLSGDVLQFYRPDGGALVCIGMRAVPRLHDNIRKRMAHRNPINHPAVMFRKSAIVAVGGYPRIYPEDYMLWAKMMVSGYRFHNLDECLLWLRTDECFLRRRGWQMLMGEITVYNFLRRHGVIGTPMFMMLSSLRCLARLSPAGVKRALYGLVARS